jgi:hypothetical protein
MRRKRKKKFSRLILVATLALFLLSAIMVTTPNAANAEFWVFKTLKNIFHEITTILVFTGNKDLNDNIPEKNEHNTAPSPAGIKQLISLSEAVNQIGYPILLPKSVPDRYTLSGIFIENSGEKMSSIEVHYSAGDKDDIFVITQSPLFEDSGFSFNFRTNDAETKNIIINGLEATLLIYRDRTQLLWQQQVIYYMITGPLTEDEIIAIATSLN